MADSELNSAARLLVRADLSAVRIDRVLVGGLRPVPSRGPSPEVAAGARVDVGRLYPDHNASGGQTWVPRWELRGGDDLDLTVHYWGEGGLPEGETGPATAVGRIRGTLIAAAGPTATGPVSPTAMAPESVQVILRYTVKVQGSEAGTRRELVLGRLRTPLVGEAAARLDVPIRSQQDAEVIYAALTGGPDTVLLLRGEVETWQRTWNQTVVGQASVPGVAHLLPTRDFAVLKDTAAIRAAVGIRATVAAPTTVVQPVAVTPVEVTPVAVTPVAVTPVAVTPVAIQPVLVQPVAVTPTRLAIDPSVLARLRTVRLTPRVATEPTPAPEPAPAPAPEAPAEPAPVPITGARLAVTTLSAARLTALSETLSTARVLRMPAETLSTTTATTLVDAGAVARVSRLQLAGKAVAPARAVVDARGEPAWVCVHAPVEWELPFYFPLGGPHSDVYETGTLGREGASTILEAVSGVTDAAGRPILGVYREVILRNRIHLVPQVYRLARAPASPCLPELRMVASDFVVSQEDAAEPIYRVSVAYALEPWLPPGIREAVGAALGIPPQELQISVTAPTTTSLRLTLPDGPSDRTAATLDANCRISDVLDLSPEAFAQLVRTLRDDPAGVRGTVTVGLLDGQQTAESSVQLGLGFESDFLLDTVVTGRAAEPGVWSVRLRNRIESKVRLEECRAIPLPGGAFAAPVAASVPIGAELRPGEWVDVTYQLTPAEAPFVVETLPVRATPIPDVESLLRTLVVPTGGAGAVTVSVTGRFPSSTPDGSEAIVALRVEFDDESSVELTPLAPSATVQLSGRLLDIALGKPVQRYFYRVQNITSSGPGAASGWVAADVGAPLVVPWVVATFPDSF